GSDNQGRRHQRKQLSTRDVSCLSPLCSQAVASLWGDLWGPQLAACAQSIILPPSARAVSFTRPGSALKEFGSILVAPERRSPGYLQKFIQSEIEKWAALIRAANLKAE